jgi:hypothetical protein
VPQCRCRNLAISIDSVTGAADGVCPTPYAAINMMLYDKHGDFSDNPSKPAWPGCIWDLRRRPIDGRSGAGDEDAK